MKFSKLQKTIIYLICFCAVMSAGYTLKCYITNSEINKHYSIQHWLIHFGIDFIGLIVILYLILRFVIHPTKDDPPTPTDT
jgi:hypothetical protein